MLNDDLNALNGNLLSDTYLTSLESHLSRANDYCIEMDRLQKIFAVLEAGPSLRSYALEKFELKEIVSTEDTDRAAIIAWDRVKVNLRRFQSDLYGYAKVIQSGADRLVERLEILRDISEKANDVPFKDKISIRKNKKFSINGGFQPFDIRPLLENTNNTFDFLDKVLLPFLKQVEKLLNDVDANQTWPDNTKMHFELLEASKWMKNFKPLKEPDDRFRIDASVVRGVTTQGDKAIYYSCLPETNTENPKDWNYFINTIKNIRYRFISIAGQQPINESDNTIDVENANTIRQRLGYLIGIAKRIQGRSGYDQKISTELRKLERSADKVRNNTRSIRTQVNSINGDSAGDNESSNVSDIVKNLVTIVNSITRLVHDFNNAVAGQLRLTGALGFIADLELKAYEAPIEKPTPEIQERLD